MFISQKLEMFEWSSTFLSNICSTTIGSNTNHNTTTGIDSTKKLRKHKPSE